MDGGRQSGIEPDHAHDTLPAGRATGNGHPHFQRIEHRELVEVAIHEIGELQQQALPLEGLGLAPLALESSSRSADCRIDIDVARFGNVRKQLAGGGIGGFEGLARRRRRPSPANEEPLGCQRFDGPWY